MKSHAQINRKKIGMANLLGEGVKKLKNFGFLNVTEENILSDEVYCFFFSRFLEVLKGKSDELDKQIEELLNKIKENK